MAACIPFLQWLQYNDACKAKTSTFSVKGFGYSATGLAGLRAYGDLNFSVTPASVVNFASGNAPLVSTPSAAPPTPSVTAMQPTINTTPVYDPSDPCYYAAQTPCPAGTGCPASCPTGFHSIGLVTAPGAPAQCVCGKDKAVAPPAATTGPAPYVAPPVQANVAAGGFSHWGLLAAVVVGGGALYLVTRKKQAA
jgi:hypothetical protein